MNRQLNLINFGVLCILVACAGSPKPTNDNEPATPWLSILDSARYAQNAHNMQSWAFYSVSNNSLTGGLDPERLLPYTDPESRQLILSLGALTEAARLTAAGKNLFLSANWVGPTQKPVNGNWPDVLFEWQLNEGKAPYSALQFDALSSATTKYATHTAKHDIAELEQLARQFSNDLVRFQVIHDETQLNALKLTAKEAFAIEMSTERTARESILNTHYGKKARTQTPYGITLLPNFTKNKVAFIEFLARVIPQSDASYANQAVKMFNPTVETANVMIAMITKGNTPDVWFESGQTMQALWAEMIARDLSMLPLSQGLQEYPEVAKQLNVLQSQLANKGERVQMLWSITAPNKGEFLRSPRIDARDLLS